MTVLLRITLRSVLEHPRSPQALPPASPSTLYGCLRHFGGPQLNFRLILRYALAFAIHLFIFEFLAVHISIRAIIYFSWSELIVVVVKLLLSTKG